MSNCSKTSRFKYDAFLSCAGEDKIYVKEFYNKLRQYGAKVFYYDVLEDGAYGRNPNNFLVEVLKNSQHLIFYWTRNSNKEWTNKEIKYFDENCKNGKNREIIVYHDIVGKTDYTQLPENLKDDYFREVDLGELLKRIGADSASYMERRYFRLIEFLKKPEKKIDVEIKVGVGCCIWAAPVIRKIMDDGGIAHAKITFFEKYQFEKKKSAVSNGKDDQTEKYEIVKSPYFYSRNNKSKLLTIPPYLKGCQVSREKFNSAWLERLKPWPPYFNKPDVQIASVYFKDILAEKYEKFTIYQVPDTSTITPATPKNALLFMENSVEGVFLRMPPAELNQTYFHNILKIFFEIDTQNAENFSEVFKKKLHNNIEKQFNENALTEIDFKLNQSYFDSILKSFIGNLEPGISQKINKELQGCDNNFKIFLGKKINSLKALIAQNEKDINSKENLMNLLKNSFPLFLKILKKMRPRSSKEVLSGMKEWYKVLVGLYKILSITSVNYVNNFENDFSKADTYKLLEDTISSFTAENENKNVNIKIYQDDKSRKLLVLDKEYVKSNSTDTDNGHAILGYINQLTLNDIKNRFDNRVDFDFYNEIGDTKLYTARDIVGLIHEESLDCVIVPSEVYEQEHEKGKNKNVLTKIASIMYTVAGGCDFLFISKKETEKKLFEKLIKEGKQDQLNKRLENKEKCDESDERKIRSLFRNLKEKIKYDEIKILYTSNTVSKKYHEKYFTSPDIIHEPVDVGEWDTLKKKIQHILDKEGRLLVLGWQPQISWIEEYFKDGNFVCDENLMLLEGTEDLPYLSYDIMLRTNVLNTWFRSFAFESFLNTVKDSITELNKCMQSQVDTVDTPVEVQKIAAFLNMKESTCKDYLKKINFEFRYDSEYTKLYEKYIKRMNIEY